MSAQKGHFTQMHSILLLCDVSSRDQLTYQRIDNYTIFIIFTAQGYAKRGICRRRVSVCVGVCVSVYLSVTLWYCIKMAKRRIMQIMLHDSPITLVF